jgi:hypothetical protein
MLASLKIPAILFAGEPNGYLIISNAIIRKKYKYCLLYKEFFNKCAFFFKKIKHNIDIINKMRRLTFLKIKTLTGLKNLSGLLDWLINSEFT